MQDAAIVSGYLQFRSVGEGKGEGRKRGRREQMAKEGEAAAAEKDVGGSGIGN